MVKAGTKNDWKEIELAKECSFERGVEPGAKAYNTDGIGSRFIRVVDVTDSRDQAIYVDIVTNKRVTESDILLTLDGTIGAVKRGLRGVYSTGVRKVSFVSDNSNDYLYYLLQSNNIQKTIWKYSSGSTIQHSSASISYLHARIPTEFWEQEKIASVLARLEAVIDNTSSILQKYTKVQTGIIQDLFKYGVCEDGSISRSVKLQHTKIGACPSSWSVVSLGEVATVFNGTTPSMSNNLYWQDGSIPWVSSGRINDYIIKTPTNFITDLALKKCSLHLIPKNSVLVAMVGNGKTRGMSARTDIETTINQNLAAIIPVAKELDSLYLQYYLGFVYERLRNSGRGSNQDALTCGIIRDFQIPLPSINEQKRISKILSNLEILIQFETDNYKKLGLLKRGLLEDLLSGSVSVSGLDNV